MNEIKKSRFLQRLGSWIASLRRDRGIGQDTLTEEAGLAKGTISKIESGNVDPKATTLVRLAKAMRISPQRLFDFGSF